MRQVYPKTTFYKEKDMQHKKKHDLPHIDFFVSYEVGFDLKLYSMHLFQHSTKYSVISKFRVSRILQFIDWNLSNKR